MWGVIERNEGLAGAEEGRQDVCILSCAVKDSNTLETRVARTN